MFLLILLLPLHGEYRFFNTLEKIMIPLISPYA